MKLPPSVQGRDAAVCTGENQEVGCGIKFMHVHLQQEVPNLIIPDLSRSRPQGGRIYFLLPPSQASRRSQDPSFSFEQLLNDAC